VPEVSTKRIGPDGVVHEMWTRGTGTACDLELPEPWEWTDSPVTCLPCMAAEDVGFLDYLPDFPSKRLLVTGSRGWPTWDGVLPRVLRAVYDYAPLLTLVVGYDPVRKLPAGVDRMAFTLWRELGGTVEPHPADWQRVGKGAGRMRNVEMVRSWTDMCLAFILNESPGASHCAEAADKAGIPVVAFREPRRG
jgi:hypothetical protein